MNDEEKRMRNTFVLENEHKIKKSSVVYFVMSAVRVLVLIIEESVMRFTQKKKSSNQMLNLKIKKQR